MNARQQNAWMYHGGGRELLREFLQGLQHRRASPPATPARRWAAGSARKSRRVADLKGLKMRIGGFAGGCCSPSSASCRSRSPAATSIRRWKRARSTRRSGSARTTTRSSASTRSPSTTTTRAGGKAGRELDLFVNIKAWDDLPKDYQAILESACAEANVDMVAKYDALNPPALKRLLANGVKLRPFSNDIMAACYKATQRSLRRDRDQEREVQEDLRAVEEIPRRRSRVVRGRREPVRQLHDRHAAAAGQKKSTVEHPPRSQGRGSAARRRA